MCLSLCLSVSLSDSDVPTVVSASVMATHAKTTTQQHLAAAAKTQSPTRVKDKVQSAGRRLIQVARLRRRHSTLGLSFKSSFMYVDADLPSPEARAALQKRLAEQGADEEDSDGAVEGSEGSEGGEDGTEDPSHTVCVFWRLMARCVCVRVCVVLISRCVPMTVSAAS